MKPHISWSWRPYRPLLYDVGEPYICQVLPDATGIEFAWLPVPDAQTPYTVWFSARGAQLQPAAQTEVCRWHISGLEPDTEYQFQVSCGSSRSRVRLARTGAVEGTVVNYLHPEDPCYAFSGQYLCSPSIVRHPQGHLLASMDLFAGNTPQNLTLIFRSDDDGRTWQYLAELFPCFWGKMFVHRDRLYMLGCSTEYGDLLIGRSDDGGATFTAPTVLWRGSCKGELPGIHKNPQPVVEYNHRLWNTLEWGCWHQGTHAAMVMSADVDADLLDAESWRLTPPVPYDPAWPGTAEGPSAGNIEGTLVTAPDGNLYNIMRYDMYRCRPSFGRVLAYRVNTDDPDAPLEYSHAIPFPGNHSKFMIKKDEQTGLYLSIVSRLTDAEHNGARNLLSLVYSADLEHWELACDLIDRRDEDPKYTGFQYVDFIMEGDDLLWLCRTALNHPHNYHDANYSVFHRLADFRSLLPGA